MRIYTSYQYTHTVGCKNGTGWFRKTLETFQDLEWPDFKLVQKMRLKQFSSLMQ